MQASSLEDTLRHVPFRPFEIHVDGRVIPVDNPEQVMISPDKITVVMIASDSRIHVLDMKRISSLTLKARFRRGSSKSVA